MEVIGELVFFTQGQKLLSLDIESNKIKVHIGHSDDITSLAQCSNLLFTGSLDGCIVKWCLPSIISYKINSAIKLMTAGVSEIYFLKANTQVLYKLDISSDSIHPTSYFKGLLNDAIDLKYKSENIVLLKPYSVVVHHTPTSNASTYDYNILLTALAIHPQDKYIAIGNNIGQIIKLYPNYSSTLHWHAHKVTNIDFTSDGNYMLSGGEEGVVVLWHETTNQKTFLPRLGCTIKKISVSIENNYYVIKLVNNLIKVFRTSDYKQIAGYTTLVSPEKMLPGSRVHTGIVWQDSHAVLNAGPGFVQLYDTETGTIEFIDCENRNLITRSNEDYPYPLEVKEIKFIEDFMSVLLVSDSKYMKLSQLKFWKGKILNTLIMHPHGDTAHKIITHLNYFVTIGRTSFIVWEYKNQWSGVVERKHGNLNCLTGASSKFLYVSFENVITEWDDKMECTKEIFEPTGNPVVYLEISEDSLIAGTVDSIHIFRNGIITWSIELGYIHGICAENDNFVVGLNASKYTPSQIRKTRTNILLKFNTQSSIPVKIYKVNNIHSFTIKNSNVIVIDKFFEYNNLDTENKTYAEDIPFYKVPEISDNHTYKKNGLVSRYLETNHLEWLDKALSHDLPDTNAFFSQIVLASSY